MDAHTFYLSLFGMGFVLFILALAAIIVVALIRAWQVKISPDKAYQTLAEKLLLAQQQHADSQEQTIRELEELRRRIGTIEKTLREIE